MLICGSDNETFLKMAMIVYTENWGFKILSVLYPSLFMLCCHNNVLEIQTQKYHRNISVHT